MSPFEDSDRPAEPPEAQPEPPSAEPPQAPSAEPPQAPSDGASQPASPAEVKPHRRTRRSVFLGTIVLSAAVGVFLGVTGALRQDPLDVAVNEMLRSLPAEARDRLTADLKDILATQTAGLSKEATQARMSELSRKGYARLDDRAAIRRLQLVTAALGQADTATCGVFARASLSGTSLDPSVALKLISALDTPDLQEWFEMSVAAIKHEVAGEPPAVVVSDADFQRAIAAVVRGYSSDEMAALQLVTGTPKQATDAEACEVERRLYRGIGTLAPADLVIVARFDIQG